jgi:hypothetical protein
LVVDTADAVSIVSGSFVITITETDDEIALVTGEFVLGMTQPPANPKLYHIVHVDKLASIAADGRLVCDAEMMNRQNAGTTIGMSKIKQRRLQLQLVSRPGLKVGECVPFYYCPRSVMLYLLYQGNYPDLEYHGGQGPIVHLELDLNRILEWAEERRLRWAITLSNAGAYGFEDRLGLDALGEIDWDSIRATDWRDPDIKHRKQAEFLVEREVDWALVERIGVYSMGIGQRALAAIGSAPHQPRVEVMRHWYY